MLQTPISLSSSVFAARCSSVLTLTLYFGSVMVAATVLRADLQPVRPAGQHRLVAPSRRSSPRTGRRPPAGRPAAAITSPRLTSISSASVSVTDCPATASSRSPSMRDDARDPALAPGGQHADARRPGATMPLTIVPAKPRKSRFGPVDPLHRQAERPLLHVVLDLDRLEVAHQRRARRTRACRRSASVMLSPLQARDRDRDDVGRGRSAARTRGSPSTIASKRLLRVADEVHLVDREHDVADAEQRHEVAVPARLRQHALARVDQDDGEVGGRGAGHHVARVLLVARRVGDDELALVGREEAIGDVDRDALLALGGEAVDQQREVELAALRADLLRVGLERGQLVLEDHLRVVEQPADQRALAVVDAAAGDEAQQALVLVLAAGRPRCPCAMRSETCAIRSTPPASSSPSTPPGRGR